MGSALRCAARRARTLRGPRGPAGPGQGSSRADPRKQGADAPTLPDFVAALPLNARATFDGVTDPDQLWQADARWWAQVERDALVLARHPCSRTGDCDRLGGVMATDAWRVRGALELALRGGTPLEAFDAMA